MLFHTSKKESNYSAWYRRVLNIWPCIWGSGGKMTFVSGDFKRVACTAFAELPHTQSGGDGLWRKYLLLYRSLLHAHVYGDTGQRLCSVG